MARQSETSRGGAVSRHLRAICWLASLGAIVGSAGCAKVAHTNRDTLVRTRTEKKVLSGWSFTAAEVQAKEGPLSTRAVTASLQRDRACLLTEIRTVDRTVVTERTYEGMKRARIMSYTMGSLGAASAITNVYVATQAKSKDVQTVAGVFAGIGAYMSLMFVVQLAFELAVIDSESHVGLVDLSESRPSRCDAGPAEGARVRLLRTRSVAVAEGVADAKGNVHLPVDVGADTGDAIYALEVDGVIVRHVEVPGGKPPAVPAAKPDASVEPAPSSPPSVATPP